MGRNKVCIFQPFHSLFDQQHFIQKKGGRRPPPDDDRADLIEKPDMVNERFFSYYKAQNIVPEEEWEAFLESLRTHLPTTFRVAGSRQCVTTVLESLSSSDWEGRTANTLNATIRDVHVPGLSNVEFEGQQILPPVQLPWCVLCLPCLSLC
jgi:multisite-specific tRNA:(cytosine-C5)-methyltransferase